MKIPIRKTIADVKPIIPALHDSEIPFSVALNIPAALCMIDDELQANGENFAERKALRLLDTEIKRLKREKNALFDVLSDLLDVLRETPEANTKTISNVVSEALQAIENTKE